MDDLTKAVADFTKKWQALMAERKNKAFFEDLRPMSAAWKVEDLADFDTRFAALRDRAKHIGMTWMNERWLATFYLREPLENGIQLINLMQRRPGSTDAVGLDHLDFYSPQVDTAEEILKEEPELKWTHEDNGPYCAWISIWFAGTEAKLRNTTKLGIMSAEWRDLNEALLKKSSRD